MCLGNKNIKKIYSQRFIVPRNQFIHETLTAFSIEAKEINTIGVAQPSSWMAPIILYLTTYELRYEEMEVKIFEI